MMRSREELEELENVARANGYWHHIEPFADRIRELEAMQTTAAFTAFRGGCTVCGGVIAQVGSKVCEDHKIIGGPSASRGGG